MKPDSMSEASGAAAAAALGLIVNSFDDEHNDISIEGTARFYIIRSLLLDSMGLISHAASTAKIGVDACSRISDNSHNQGGVSENVSALEELSIQLHHFTRALYVGLLHPDADFIRDWLGCSLSKLIVDILEAWVTISTAESENGSSCSPASIIEVIVSYIRPMSEGPFCMYQSCSRENLFNILSISLESESNTTAVTSYSRGSVLDRIKKASLHYKDQEKDEVYSRLLRRSANKIASVENSTDSAVDTLVEDAIERVIVTALGRIVDCSKNRLDGLEAVLELASASLPTLPRGQRCLRSPMRLASLVVTACGSYDNMYTSLEITSSGTDVPPQYLPLMWQLIETTPTSLVAFDLDGLPKESDAISAQLDVIQAALAVSEVVQCYMATPPFFLLLGDQSERGDSSRIVRSDSSHIRRARRMYIRDLLTGCGFLIAGLEAITADSDATHDDEKEKESLLSSSVEILSNMVSMGQALILRMCYEYGRAQRVAASSGRSNSGEEGNSRWAATAQDVMHLCSSFKSRAVPPVWAGHALLQCMLFFNGVDSDFKYALKTITNLESRRAEQKSSSNSPQDTHIDAELGTTLHSLSVESAHMERLVLKRAVEIFNSVSSCESAELREVESLLSILPQHAKCPVLTSAVRYERALMEIVGLLSTLQVDLLPLQLRMLSPPDIAKKLLTQKPQAYYELNAPGDVESLYCIDDGEEDGDRTDLLLKRNSLRDKQPPGSLLISVLSTLHDDSPKTAPVTASCPSTLLHTVVAVQLELLFAAISLSDLEGAYCLCRVLLMAAANTGDTQGVSSLPIEALQRISESALLVMGMLDCPDPSSEELHHALRSDLLSIMLTRTPVAELDRFSSLWRHLPVLTTSDAADHPDDVNISAATLALLDTVVRMLKRSDDPHQSSSSSSSVHASEVVANSGSDTGRLSDAIGHLLLVQDSAKVHGLIEKLYADLDRKLSSTLMKQGNGNGQSNGYGRGGMTLDESLVSMVISKGFSRNSSKRAVLATRGEGFREALSWAVEHSRDEDFEFPIAEAVKGALLSNKEDSYSLDPERMKAALKVLADVSEMYQRHCMSLSGSGSGINKTSAISGSINESVSASPSRGASILLQDIYPAEEPEEWHTAEEQRIEQRQERHVEIPLVAEDKTVEVDEMIYMESPIHASMISPRSLSLAPLPPMYTGMGKIKPIPRAAVFDFKGGDLKIISPRSAVSTPIELNNGISTPSSAAASAESQASPQEAVVESPIVVEILETVETLVTPPTNDEDGVKVEHEEEVVEVEMEEGVDNETGVLMDVENVVAEMKSADMRSVMLSNDDVLLSPVSLFAPPNLPPVHSCGLDSPSALTNGDEAPLHENPVYIGTIPTIDSPPLPLLPPQPLQPVSLDLHVAIDESLMSEPPSDKIDLASGENSVAVAEPAVPEAEEPLTASLPVSLPTPTPLPLSAPVPAALPVSLPTPLPVPLPVTLPTPLPLPLSVPFPALLPLPVPLPLPAKEVATPTVPSAVASVRTSVISATNSTVMKAHLVSRLRGVLDVAEDFTGIGVNAADLSRSVINGEGDGAAEGEGEIGGACDQIFQMCRSLATHRRIAAFQFLPQLLLELPVRFQSDVALKAEGLIFGNAPSSSQPSGVPLDDSLWALAALRLLVYHKVADAAAYSVCCTTLYADLNGSRTVALLAYLYKGLEGSNLDALIGIKKLAADHLSPMVAADSSSPTASSSAASTTGASVNPPVSVKCMKDVANAILSTSSISIQSSTLPSLEVPSTSSSPSIVALAFKQLQDDIAVLNRVRRIPDATGVNAKSLLKLQSDDLYWVQGDCTGGSHQDDMDTKRRYRRQTLLAVGPYLYPQTITNWVRVIGKQLGLGSTDFNFQYACCTLSTTVMKALKSSNGEGRRGLGLDADSWALLANELSSSVKRMKPEHTIALCYIVGGIALPEAAWYSGCEMLFPMGEIPDQAVDALLSAILTAVQTVALPTSPTAAARAATSVPIATPTLYSLTAQQALQLLPSVTSVRDLLSVVHQCLQPLSPFRDAVLLMCLDRTGALEDLLASILCSAVGCKEAVLQLVTACSLLRTGEMSRAQNGSPAPCYLTTASSVEAITAKSLSLISDLITAVGSEEKEKPLGASDIALTATRYLLLHSHSNFGPLATHKIFEELCALICQSSQSPTPSDREGEVVNEGTVTDSFLDCCINVLSVCNSIISDLIKDSSQGQGEDREKEKDSSLSELLQCKGEPALELLLTRRIVSEVLPAAESDYWSEEEAAEPISIRVFSSSEPTQATSTVHHDNTHDIFILSNTADRERLFTKLCDLVSEVPGPAVESAVRALVRLLRCWGVSKNNGSLQKALEEPFIPLSPSSPVSTDSPSSSSSSSFSHPAWLPAQMHLSLWGRTLQLMEKGGMHVDMVEVLLVDLNFNFKLNFNPDLDSVSHRCINVTLDVEIEKHISVIRQLITSLIKNPTVPSAIKHAFGLACGGSHAMQAVRDMQGDMTGHPSDSFSISLFMLLLSLADRDIVSMVARSPDLLLTLVRMTSKCLESRLTCHFRESSDDFASDPQQTMTDPQPCSRAPQTLLQLLNSLPDSAGQEKERGVGSASLSGAMSRCGVLPMMLSPCYLVALLLDGGFFCQAAHIHWTAVMRRPQSMYTADAAASLLFDHFSSAALPFYLVASSAPREMLGGVWGWGRWKALCEAALSK